MPSDRELHDEVDHAGTDHPPRKARPDIEGVTPLESGDGSVAPAKAETHPAHHSSGQQRDALGRFVKQQGAASETPAKARRPSSRASSPRKTSLGLGEFQKVRPVELRSDGSAWDMSSVTGTVYSEFVTSGSRDVTFGDRSEVSELISDSSASPDPIPNDPIAKEAQNDEKKPREQQ